MTQDGHAATLELERQLITLERSASGGLRWPWLLIVVGLLMIAVCGWHGYIAHSTIARIDVPAQIATQNPVLLFQDIATNGPRVGNTVENSSRATYTRALEQYVLDATGVMLGLALVAAGLFVRGCEGWR